MSKRCIAQQVNQRVPDFDCKKDAGHSGGHIDSKSGKVWGTPRLPYGMRRTKGGN